MKVTEFSRHRTPPGGWSFRQPQSGWVAPTPIGSTFDQTVQLIVAHRRANPAITAKNNLATNTEAVASELERYTRKRLGLPEDTQAPFLDSHKSYAKEAVGVVAGDWADRARQVTTGVMTLKDWLVDGPVERDLAEKRAATCVQREDGKPCPKHKAGDWASFFTAPVANLIRKQVEEKSGMNLFTSRDKELGVCDACGCMLGVKIWVKKTTIMNHIKEPEFNKLDNGCWIKTET